MDCTRLLVVLFFALYINSALATPTCTITPHISDTTPGTTFTVVMTMSAFPSSSNIRSSTATGDCSFSGGSLSGTSLTYNVVCNVPRSAQTIVATLTDSNGSNSCSSNAFNVIVPFGATISGTNPLCNGGATGSVTVTATGGSGSYTYTWTPNSVGTSASVSGLTAQAYSVVVSDGAQTVTKSITLTDPAVLSGTTTQTNVFCLGGSTGIAGVTATGGTLPYSYTWSTGATTSSISGLAAGTYTVTFTDAHNCPSVGPLSYVITQPSTAVQATSPQQTDVLCRGAATGSASITATGGISPYSYAWTGSSSLASSALGLTAGTYTVTITDNQGCASTPQSFTINQPATALSASSQSQTNVPCFGQTGSATVAATGGTGAYTYAWDHGLTSTTDTANSLVAGTTYTVTVTDANSCTATQAFPITGPTAPLAIAPTQVDVLCFGQSTGSATATVSGGTTPYTLNWHASLGSSATVSNLPVGTYTVDVTDANNCPASQSYTITGPTAALTFTPTQQNVLCYGDLTGSASVTAAGGTGTYTYSWTPSVSTSASASNIAAGSYSVVITDSNSCPATANFVITQPTAALSITPSHTNVNCKGDSTGSFQVTVAGGTPSYTYAWTPSITTTPSAPAVPAGTYSVLITDAHSCTATTSIIVTEPAASLSVVPSHTDVHCHGAGTGAVSVAASGGTGAYTYAWVPSSLGSLSAASSLSGGTYSSTVTDANGCLVTQNIVVAEPAAFAITGSHTSVMCYGGTATVTTTPTGGTGPFTYNWAPAGGQSAVATDVPAGIYTMTATDSCAVTRTQSIIVPQPNQLALVPSQINVACYGEDSGVALVYASGGTPPYTYSWSPSGGSAATATGLVAGTYTVTVTDANGCVASQSFAISQPDAIVVTYTQSPVQCYGGKGSATLTVTGGTHRYLYAWEPLVSNGRTATDLVAGTYDVTITDSNFCPASASVVITQPSAPLTLSGSQTNVACYGGTGSATVTAAGGTPGYTYSWSPSGGTSATASGLSAGSYTVTVRDANGCTQTQSFTIIQPAAALAISPSQQDVACKGTSTGSATAVVSGGTGPYTYAWSPSTVGSAAFASGLYAGSYSLTVTDAHSCTAQQTYTITEPAVALTLTASQADVLCNGDSTATATVSVSGGGSAAYTYAWTPSVSTGASANGLAVGTYAVSVTDSRQCTITHSFTISQPSAIEVIQAYNNVSCKSSATGSASLVASGGVGDYSYSWSTGDVSDNITALEAGDYMVTVSDANQCSQNVSFTISEPTDELAITVGKVNVGCIGSSTGTAAVVATGGYPGYTYQWSTGSTDNSISGLVAGEYSVVVTDSSGCFKTIHFNITEPEIEYCQNNGTCTGLNACSCNALWSGLDCSLPVCANGCLNGGNCTAPGNCTCPTGFSGPSCAEADAVASNNNQATKVGLGVGLGLGVPAAAAAGVFVFKYASTLRTMIPGATRA